MKNTIIVASTLLGFCSVQFLDSSRKKDGKELLKNCKTVICKMVPEETDISPETPTLPEFRVLCNHPFENVGIYYPEPSYFKEMLTIVLECQNFKCCF